MIHACIYVCEVCICSYHINSSIICIFRRAQWFGSFNFLSIFTNLQKWEEIFYCFNILINIYIYNKSKFTRHFLLKSQESERSCIRVLGLLSLTFPTILLLDFGTVPTVWYFFIFIQTALSVSSVNKELYTQTNWFDCQFI